MGAFLAVLPRETSTEALDGDAVQRCGGVPGAVSALRGGLCGGAAVRMGNRLPGKPLFRRVGAAVQGYGGGAVSEEENIRLVREIGEVKAELSAVKAELAGLRERIDDVVISNLRDHGKRMSMLETRVAALEAAENRRAGGMAALVAVAAAAGAAGNVLSRWIAG